MTEESTAPFMERCVGLTPTDRRNQLRVLWACLLWAVLFVAVSLLLKRDLLPEGPVSWTAAALPTLASLFLMVVYGRFLREADELQKLIQMRSLALGFGAAWVALCGYPLFERLGAPVADAGDYFLVMVVFFSVGTIVNAIRYR